MRNKLKKKVSKRTLVEKAKGGDSGAEIKLLELNQLGILEEAKNPDTSEEIAIEMLAELSASPLSNIRLKAISLIIKIVPNKILEKLVEEELEFETKENIVSTILDISNFDISILLSIYESHDIETSLKEMILNKINSIRKNIEQNAVEIMKLQNQVEELEALKIEKFKIINDLYRNLKDLKSEKLKSNKVFYDFKMDVLNVTTY